MAQWRVKQRVDGLEGQRVGNSSRSGQKLKMRSLNTQDVIQIHPAHNFVNIDQFGMYYDFWGTKIKSFQFAPAFWSLATDYAPAPFVPRDKAENDKEHYKTL